MKNKVNQIASGNQNLFGCFSFLQKKSREITYSYFSAFFKFYEKIEIKISTFHFNVY